jgi:hypothetical protein
MKKYLYSLTIRVVMTKTIAYVIYVYCVLTAMLKLLGIGLRMSIKETLLLMKRTLKNSIGNNLSSLMPFKYYHSDSFFYSIPDTDTTV